MLKNFTLAILAFVLTFSEVALKTKCNLALAKVRETKGLVRWIRIVTANWETSFEAVLLLDIWLIVEQKWLAVPILIAAWLGSMWTTAPGRLAKIEVSG